MANLRFFHFLLATGLLASNGYAADQRAGYFETAFEVIPPYARADVIAQRSVPPEKLQQITSEEITGYTIDPRDEEWQVYAPEACAGGAGCGVLVWIHADDAPRMDRKWQAVLDDAKLIYVAALRSGNDHDAFARRLPLALTGLGAIATSYTVDPARVYLGGFSGGARAAQVLGFAFPDVFHGVILDAGFLDPAGDLITTPPAPLDQHLRELPFVLVAGRRDRIAWQDFLTARGGFAKQGIEVLELTESRQGHEPLTASQLQEALDYFAAQ